MRMKSKQKLRKQMLQYRKSLSKKAVARASARVCQKLIQLDEYRQAKTILFYMAVRNEIDVLQAIWQAWQDGKSVVLPRVKGSMIECILVEQLAQLQKGTFGILEPKNGKNVDPQQLDLVIVPGVAFDVQGYRLGYGGGYYDRLFSQYPSLKRIGVLEHGQLVTTVYPEAHDQKMDVLITSEQIFRIASSGDEIR